MATLARCRLRVRRLAAGCAAWIAPAALMAQVTAAPDPINTSSLLQVAGGLIVVLLALLGSLFLLRRFSGLRTGTGKLLNIVDAISIGPRDRIVVLDVDGERVVLGISPGRIQPLLTLGPARETAPFAAELQQSVHKLEGRQ